MRLTPCSVGRPGEGIVVCCVEPRFAVQDDDLNTDHAEDSSTTHGDLVRSLAEEQAPNAKVICSGHPPRNLTGIHIINLSLADADSQGNEDGPIWNDPAYRLWITEWLNAGIVVVAPTGNIRRDIDNTLINCDRRLTVVGASDWEPGSDGLFRTDVLASAKAGNRNGTSFAAPRVAGVCAVLMQLWTRNPEFDQPLTPENVRRLLRLTRGEDGAINGSKAVAEAVGFRHQFDHDRDWKVGLGDFMKMTGSAIWNSTLDKRIKKVEAV